MMNIIVVLRNSKIFGIIASLGIVISMLYFGDYLQTLYAPVVKSNLDPWQLLSFMLLIGLPLHCVAVVASMVKFKKMGLIWNPNYGFMIINILNLIGCSLISMFMLSAGVTVISETGFKAMLYFPPAWYILFYVYYFYWLIKSGAKFDNGALNLLYAFGFSKRTE